MNFTLSSVVNPPTAFLARRAELRDRFDPEMILFRRRTHSFKYSVHQLYELFAEPPQYGAGERGLPRESPDQPRYIRITDIDEYGILSDELGATAATIEKRYVLHDDDLLIARSGNTVGKTYLHKSVLHPYPCFYAGYLIRFRFNRTVVLPDYVFAITQLPYYKAWVRAVQRAAGQPNINAQEYSSLPIPLPPVTIQEDIVAQLHAVYTAKRSKESEARRKLEQIDEVLLNELGMQQKPEPPNSIKSRIFHSGFHKLTGKRWDPNYSRYMAKFLKEVDSCLFPVHKLKDFIALVQYGISELATEEMIGVPMLRMLNLQDGDWDVSDIKYIAMDERERQPYLLNQGDILFNRTNSKELVGKCNVFNLQGEYVFASYLMRVRLKDDSELRPEYVVAYLASSLGRVQIDAVSRQIAGMTNINAEEIRDFLIPVPPRSVQDRIRSRVAEMRQRATELRVQAAAELEEAKKAIEVILLGERKAA
jgi:restriction endonuclease S subunit